MSLPDITPPLDATFTGTIDLSDIKRCYVPGIVIKTTCPNCGNAVERDLKRQYLSYPRAGSWQKDAMYCGACDHEYEIEIKLDVIATLTVRGLPTSG